MKLDATDLRYLSGDVFRVLTAVEMGSKNHEVVPVQLIAQISGLRSGGVNKCISELAKRNLVARVQNIKYDGYRLTYGGYDFLAMRTFAKRDTIYSVGNQIGTGKESDIYVVADEEGNVNCLKIHRLGRISFRTIKSKRDYLKRGQSASWMYMSRLAAMKEFAFMKVLHEHGFPVPKPIDQARHCLVMELIDAFPLRQIAHVDNPGALYSELMELIVRLARSGLIHGDFNEFNLLIREANAEKGEVNPVPILIDFPQMVSTEHENAEYYFNRDVECIRTFFRKRFRYESSVYPKFLSTVNENDGKKDFELDVMVAASGFGKKEGEALERYMKMIEEAEGDEEEDGEDGEDDEGDEDEEEDEEAEEEQLHSNAHTVLKQNGLDYASADESSEEVDKLGNRIRKSVNLEEGNDKVQNQAEPDRVGSSSNEEEEEEEEQDDEANSSEAEESEEDEASQKEGSTTRQQQQRRKAMERATRDTTAARKPRDVQAIVTSSLAKHERSKHHGKKSRTDAGRSKGSKKKADPRYKMANEF